MERDSDWIAPLLWLSELRNVLTKLHRQHGLDLRTALAIADAAEMFMRGREFEVSSRPVLELATESGRSAYDCEFVALAMHQEVPLVTSDRQLTQAFPRVAMSPGDFTAG